MIEALQCKDFGDGDAVAIGIAQSALQSGTRDDETEHYVIVGYRYDFDAEGPVVRTGPQAWRLMEPN